MQMFIEQSSGQDYRAGISILLQQIQSVGFGPFSIKVYGWLTKLRSRPAFSRGPYDWGNETILRRQVFQLLEIEVMVAAE